MDRRAILECLDFCIFDGCRCVFVGFDLVFSRFRAGFGKVSSSGCSEVWAVFFFFFNSCFLFVWVFYVFLLLLSFFLKSLYIYILF